MQVENYKTGYPHTHPPQFQNEQTNCEKENHETIKEMSDKCDYIKIKHFCSSKDHLKKEREKASRRLGEDSITS